MKKLLVCLLVFPILANAGDKDTVNQIIAFCNADNVNSMYGDCVKENLNEMIPAWHNDIDAPFIDAYIQWSNAAGARVDSGEITADQARQGSAQLLQRLRVQAKQNRQSLSGGSNNFANGLAAFFAGMAIVAGAKAYNQQQYEPPPVNPSTVYNFPGSRPITCTPIGHTVNCF